MADSNQLLRSSSNTQCIIHKWNPPSAGKRGWKWRGFVIVSVLFCRSWVLTKFAEARICSNDSCCWPTTLSSWCCHYLFPGFGFFPTKSGLTSRVYLPLYRFARAHQSLFRIIWPQVGIVWTLNPNILVSFALRDLCKGGWSTNQQRPLQPPCPTCLWPNYLTTPAYLLATHLLLKSSWVKLDATSSSRILIPEFFPELLNSISSWS